MNIRLIIADDHPIFIDGMKGLLSSVAGIEVIAEALNGNELVEKVRALKPDVVLTDIQMPVKDGIEATKEIHKQFPDIKVVALTMLNESLYIKKMLEAGASGYVLKTIDKEELIAVIKKVAAGEKHFSAEVTSQLLNNYSGKTSPPQTLADTLTKREKEILVYIAHGLTDKEIAEKVYLSPLTIITHRKNILSKLGLKNKAELTRFAMENNLGA
ncbi:MAG: response regulator containing a CheY-like receiver domain and an DNA-binding domain [Bacteroidetes bacterium]|nr:response regulator containing a CheY-like receiver domain and an DNA-binding domain [Bacteroidota bacterium]